MNYTVILQQEPDGGFVATVPVLPGCVSQGDSRSEALKNIHEAIAVYLDDCREAGDEIPSEAGREIIEVERPVLMGKLPADLPGWRVRQALERAGFVFRRQRGSHMVLRRDRPPARVVVPDHPRVRKGTLRAILHDAGLTADEFVDLL